MDGHNNIAEVQPTDSAGYAFRHLTRLPIGDMTRGSEIKEIWEKLQTEDYAFDDFTRGKPDVFMANLFRPDTEHFRLEQAGYVLLEGIRFGVNAVVHHAIWDKQYPIQKINAAGVEILDYAFREYDLPRITTIIPSFNRYGRRFATLLGFRYEGEMRDYYMYHGKRYGLQFFGILRNEFYSKGKGVH